MTKDNHSPRTRKARGEMLKQVQHDLMRPSKHPSSWTCLTLFNLLTLGIAQASLALLSLNRKFQDDYWRYLLFLHSFWCSQFNTYVKSHHSLLTTQKSVASACHCPHLSKNKKREFWTEWRKCKNYQPSYSQANTKPWKTLRKHTKKRLKCFLSFT